MSYRVIEDYRTGVPQTPNGTVGPFLMFALHDTEGGVGNAGALNTLYFLIDRKDRNASYHELWSWNEWTRSFIARRIVKSTSAAHSVNPYPPSKGGSYEPDAIVRRALGARVNDPNRVVYAVSIAGTKADVNRWSKDPEFVAFCERRLKEISKEINMPHALGEHFRINPSTRTDWGPLLTPAITRGGNMADIDEFKLEVIRIDKDANIRSGPNGSADILFKTGNTSSALRIGTKGDWSAYWIRGSKRWGYTQTSVNVLGVKPYINKVEVEVPTGITLEDLDKAANSAEELGVEIGEENERSRLRQLLGL